MDDVKKDQGFGEIYDLNEEPNANFAVCSESLGSEDTDSETDNTEVTQPMDTVCDVYDTDTSDTLSYLETMPRSKFEEQFGQTDTTLKYLIRDHDRKEFAKELVRATKEVPPVMTSLKAAIQMKHNWIEYYANQMFQCFYRGNLAIFRCEHCNFCLDCFPCKEKREYAIPKSRCCYCTRTMNNIGSYCYFDSVTPTHYVTKHYRVKEEKGLKYI